LMYKSQKNPATAKEVLKFYDWSYKHGGDMAIKLDYVPMPEKVIEMVEKTWAKDIRATNGDAIWK